jgi:hypothetical protein
LPFIAPPRWLELKLVAPAQQILDPVARAGHGANIECPFLRIEARQGYPSFTDQAAAPIDFEADEVAEPVALPRMNVWTLRVIRNHDRTRRDRPEAQLRSIWTLLNGHAMTSGIREDHFDLVAGDPKAGVL